MNTIEDHLHRIQTEVHDLNPDYEWTQEREVSVRQWLHEHEQYLSDGDFIFETCIVDGQLRLTLMNIVSSLELE